MKLRSLLAATALLAGSLAFAQVCPPTGSVCLVPSQTAASMQASTYMAPMASASTVTTLPYSGSGIVYVTPMVATGMTSSCPSYMQTSAVPMYNVASANPYMMQTSMLPMYNVASTSQCANVSQDTAVIVNQISALRNDVRAVQGQIRSAALQVQGQQLVSRMNQLMADEMIFRQQLAANPNLPNAQATATSLSLQAEALNRDLNAFNQQLAMVPVDQRPYVASDLNTFTVAYWNPSIQRFAAYRTQFAQTTTYQQASAANPWLQNWVTGYSSSLNSIAMIPQTYAMANWWSPSSTMVAGSMEMYPAGSMVLPQGAVIYIPAGATMTTMGTTTTTIPSTVATGTTTTGTTTTTTTTTTEPPIVTPGGGIGD